MHISRPDGTDVLLVEPALLNAHRLFQISEFSTDEIASVKAASASAARDPDGLQRLPSELGLTDPHRSFGEIFGIPLASQLPITNGDNNGSCS